MIWTIPNILTIARIVAAPCVALVFVVFERPIADWLAFGLFVGAALTDFFDGWLARKLNQTSEIGKMLDPIADKAMVIITLMVLLWTSPWAVALALPATLIVLREVLVSGLREYLGAVKLSVTRLAKWKTTIQMVAVGLLLWGGAAEIIEMERAGMQRAAGEPERFVAALDAAIGLLLGVALLWAAAILTVVSGWDYFRKGLAHIRAREAG